MRVGLTQRVETVPSYGERRDCLDQAWARLLTRHGMLPVPLCNAVEDVEPYLGELRLDGIILTGGNDLGHLPGARNAAPERDAFERRALAAAAARDLPVLGVCRGMQMMVAAAGGELRPVEGHAGTRHAVSVRPPAAGCLGARETVNSYHDYCVPAGGLGPDWGAAAAAPDGSVEAMVHRRLRQWAVMWHPERPPWDERDADLLRAVFGERPA